MGGSCGLGITPTGVHGNPDTPPGHDHVSGAECECSRNATPSRRGHGIARCDRGGSPQGSAGRDGPTTISDTHNSEMYGIVQSSSYIIC